MKRLLDYDPATRTQTWFHVTDSMTGDFVIEEIQDVEPLLELNKAIQNHDSGGAKGLNEYSKKGIKDGWWHVASIPTTVINAWLKLGVNLYAPDDWPKVKKLLNDPQWKYLRTGTGRV
jgi:hypothetical protein